MFFRIICSELLRRFTEETFLFEIYFHFSSMKTFPFGLFLIGHISVFQLNDPKSMNFFHNFWIFRISCVNCLYLSSKPENIFSGNCCWKLYTRRYFRGRKTIVAGNIEVRTLRRLGRGNRKIRSVKQYKSCEDML